MLGDVLIEQEQRDARVRFKHPIRVVTLDGQPRVIRTLTANVSRRGCFLRMPEPLPRGTRVALSLEADGRALAFAEAEVIWARTHESAWPGRHPGCGVRFTDYLHPRSKELVQYLVENLDRGRPLRLAPKFRPYRRAWPYVAAAAALSICAVAAAIVFWPHAAPTVAFEEEDEAAEEQVVAAVAPTPPPQPIAKPIEREVELPAPEPITEPVEALVADAPLPPDPEAEVPPEPAATPEPVAVARAEAPTVTPTTAGSVTLPTGAVSKLHWSDSGDALQLEVPSGHVSRAFVLAGPARAVFDVDGAGPDTSRTVAAQIPHATGVRLGKTPTGTRVVIDLREAPRQVSQDGSKLVLLF